MPDPVDRDWLRTSVHEVCVEVNKGILNNLESVLLRLVDAIEEESTSDAQYQELHAEYLREIDAKVRLEKQLAALSTERRER